MKHQRRVLVMCRSHHTHASIFIFTYNESREKIYITKITIEFLTVDLRRKKNCVQKWLKEWELVITCAHMCNLRQCTTILIVQYCHYEHCNCIRNRYFHIGPQPQQNNWCTFCDFIVTFANIYSISIRNIFILILSNFRDNERCFKKALRC